MKPSPLVRAFLFCRPLALATLLSAPLAHAQSTLTRDANNTGTPTLAAPAPLGYQLQVPGGNEIRLMPAGGSAWSGGALFAAEANNNGVANGLARVFGAPNPAANATRLRSVPDTAPDPASFSFTYHRADSAGSNPNNTIMAEYSTTLGGWTTAVDHGDTDIIVTDNHFPPSPGVDRVPAGIKRSAVPPGVRIFFRVKGVTIP